MKTMKALVKKHSKEGLWLEEVALPEVGNNDVLVKIQKTARFVSYLEQQNIDNRILNHINGNDEITKLSTSKNLY